MLHYVPPERSETGYPRRPSELGKVHDAILTDLLPHHTEFDGIVTAGDMHGVALGAVAAAGLWLPFMAICQGDHSCVVSHIVMFGEIHPDMRMLYLDDMFAFGASLAHVMGYMSQSETPNIVATYEYSRRLYRPVKLNEDAATWQPLQGD